MGFDEFVVPETLLDIGTLTGLLLNQIQIFLFYDIPDM